MAGSPPMAHYALEIMYLGLSGLCFLHARRTKSVRTYLLALLYGFLTEYVFYVEIERVAPRMYDHSERFLVMLPIDGIPFYIPFGLWATFLYVAHKASLAFMTPARAAFQPLIAAGFAMSLDLVAEPICVRWGMWVYRPPRVVEGMGSLGENWNGAPLVNLAAWAGLQFGYSAALMLVPSDEPLAFGLKLALGVLLCLMFFGPFELYRKFVSDYILVAILFVLSAVLMMFGTSNAGRANAKEKSSYWIIALIVLIWNGSQLATLPLMPKDIAFSSDTAAQLTLLGFISTTLFLSGGLSGRIDWLNPKLKSG